MEADSCHSSHPLGVSHPANLNETMHTRTPASRSSVGDNLDSVDFVDKARPATLTEAEDAPEIIAPTSLKRVLKQGTDTRARATLHSRRGSVVSMLQDKIFQYEGNRTIMSADGLRSVVRIKIFRVHNLSQVHCKSEFCTM